MIGSKEQAWQSTVEALVLKGEALLASAEKSIKVPGYPNAEKEFAQFTRKDLETFEKSAREQGLSPQEVKILTKVSDACSIALPRQKAWCNRSWYDQ